MGTSSPTCLAWNQIGNIASSRCTRPRCGKHYPFCQLHQELYGSLWRYCLAPSCVNWIQFGPQFSCYCAEHTVPGETDLLGAPYFLGGSVEAAELIISQPRTPSTCTHLGVAWPDGYCPICEENRKSFEVLLRIVQEDKPTYTPQELCSVMGLLKEAARKLNFALSPIP